MEICGDVILTKTRKVSSAFTLETLPVLSIVKKLTGTFDRQKLKFKACQGVMIYI